MEPGHQLLCDLIRFVSVHGSVSACNGILGVVLSQMLPTKWCITVNIKMYNTCLNSHIESHLDRLFQSSVFPFGVSTTYMYIGKYNSFRR